MPSNQLTDVIKHLSERNDVVGIFTTGTTASGLNPSSDIDLVVILDENKKGIRSAYTTIENRFADIFFFDLNFVKKVAEMENVPGNGFEGMFLTWLAKGKIEKDTSGDLIRLKAQSKEKAQNLAVSFEEKQDSWFKINYNFIANQRYFASENTVYHQALEIRLMYSIVELIVAYFTLREIPWRGEKEAVLYFEKNDPKTFELFRAYGASKSPSEKFHCYQNLFKNVLHGDFQEWKSDFLIVKDEKNQVDKKLVGFTKEMLLG